MIITPGDTSDICDQEYDGLPGELEYEVDLSDQEGLTHAEDAEDNSSVG